MSGQSRAKTGQSGLTLSQACMFFTVLTSILAVTTWLAYQIQNESIQTQQKQITAKQNKLTSQQKTLNQYESNLSDMVGLEEDASLNAETINQLKSSTIENYDGLNNYEGSIEDLARLLEKEIERLAMKHRKLRLNKSELERKLSLQKNRLQMYKNVYSTRQKNLNTFKQNLDTERESIEQEISNVQDDTSQALNKLDNELQKIKQQHEEKIQELELERSGVQSSLSDLKEEQSADFVTIDETDGQIIRTETEGRWAYINIGKQDRVRAGMQFGVYTRSDQTERIQVGMLKVKQVFSDYARCKIISEQDPSRPVMSDYVIANPFFSADGPKQIALVGSFPNKNNLANAIQAAGSTVQKQISPELDFVITGTTYEDSEQFAQARDLGILMSKLDNFSGFINN